MKNIEKDNTEKRDEENVPQNEKTREAEVESRGDKVEEDKLKESPKKSPGKPKDSPERVHFSYRSKRTLKEIIIKS